MSTKHPYNDGAPLPGVVDYIYGISDLGEYTEDPDLQGGVARKNPDHPYSEVYSFCGGYAIAFIMDRHDASYIVRCWWRSMGRADLHYDAVSSHVQKTGLEWLVDFRFLDNGIYLNEKWWPVLRMDRVEGEPMHVFLRDHWNNSATMEQIAAQFLEMTRSMTAVTMAHGDLQNGNILLRLSEEGMVEIRLVDYDTLAVPANLGSITDNEGLPAFQHPSRKAPRQLSFRDDAFSSLVIYLTLRALAEDPGLWTSYKLDKCDKDSLLFTKEDFATSRPSERFQRLRGLSDTVSNLALILWNYLHCPKEAELPKLHEIVSLAMREKPVRDPNKASHPAEKSACEEAWQRLSASRLPSSPHFNSAWLEEVPAEWS